MDNVIKSLKNPIILMMFLFIGALYGQRLDKGILFTVDNAPISSEEFVRVYKKNYDLVQDEEQKNVDNYLQLYINYQLKLQEARRMGLDTLTSYKREYNSYKKDLTQVYLSDNEVTEELVKEAYDRLRQDVKVTHILIRVAEDSPDTLQVIEKLKQLRPRLEQESFDTLKKDLHDGQTTYVEDLGYFSVFKMVYPFETVAFNTPIGEVSQPFKTRFGYHILKVEDKRPSRGEVTVAHIMVANDHKDSLYSPEERIKSIYDRYKKGYDFEALAKQFSDDKASAANGGKLVPFKGGQLTSPEFEEQAFSLENNGEVTQPFKTEFGWHIIQLIDKKPVESLEQVRPELEVRIKRDARSQLINDALINDLKKKYTITLNGDYLKYFTGILNDDFFKRSWKIPENLKSDAVLATIEKHPILYKDFAEYLQKNQVSYFGKSNPKEIVVKKEAAEFLNLQLIEFHENNLENINEDFAHIVKEYRDGLLLFDLMERKVWNEALKDSIRLRKFYAEHQDRYQTTETVDGFIFSAPENESLEEIRSKIKDEATLKNELSNLSTNSNIIVTRGPFEKGHQLLPDWDQYNLGTSKTYEKNGASHFIYATSVTPSEAKPFETTKGRVISDYQDFLEKQWLDSLRKTYTVKINGKELEKIKKTLGSI